MLGIDSKCRLLVDLQRAKEVESSLRSIPEWNHSLAELLRVRQSRDPLGYHAK